MHVHRVRAIVHLMGEREALMEELGVLNIPEAWSAVYRDHREEPESMTTSALAEKHNMSEDDVANIVAKMSEHEWRKKNLNDSNSYMDWCLDMMEALGRIAQIIISQFSDSLICCLFQVWTRLLKRWHSRRFPETTSSRPTTSRVSSATTSTKRR